MRLITVPLLAITIIATLCACTTNDEEEIYEGPIDWLIREIPGQPLKSARDLSLEVDQEKLKQVHQKQEDAIGECMKNKGFDYERLAFENAGYIEFSWATQLEGLPPIGDVGAAQEKGYGVPPSPRINASKSLIDGAEQPLEYSKALLGDPPVDGAEGVIRIEQPGGAKFIQTNSCIGEANRAIFPDGDGYSRTQAELKEIRYEIESIVDNDTEFLDAEREWQRCMSTRGFQAKHPTSIWFDLVTRFHEGSITGEQFTAIAKESAPDNAECVNESGYIEAHNAALERAARTVAKRAEKTLVSYTEAVEHGVNSQS